MDRAPDGRPADQGQALQLTRAEREVARRIAEELDEQGPGQQALIRRVVHELGTDLSLVFLQKAQEIESLGGMQLPDGTRRTPGGVWFRLVKEQAPQHGHPDIYKLFWYKLKPFPKEPPPPTPPKERPAPLTWAERLGIIAKLEQGNTGMITTAVLKVIGKAGDHYAHEGGCIVLHLTSTIQPAVPREVPTPQSTPTPYVVYVGKRLWGRIAKAAEDPEDEIIIEGFPQIDTETGTIALYAKKSTSKKLEAARYQKGKKPDQAAQAQKGE